VKGKARGSYLSGEVHVIEKSDVERFLEDYHEVDVSEDTFRKVKKWLYEFLMFLESGKFPKKGTSPRIPRSGAYQVSSEKVQKYIVALKKAGYSTSSMIKRLRYVKKFLRALGINEFDSLFDRELRQLKISLIWERRVTKKIVTIEDVRRLFKEVEDLHRKRKLSTWKYERMLAFLLLMVSTGRRKEEVARIKVDWIDVENGIVKFPVSETKEGRLLGVTEGYEVSFLTKEAQAFLKYFIKKYDERIQANGGYLFISQGKKDISTIFVNRIMNDYRDRLKFKLSECSENFEIAYLRKFFAEEWDRRVMKKRGSKRGLGLDVYEIVKRQIMGHSLSDVHNLHYAHKSEKELKEVYDEIYADVQVLTKEQRRLCGMDNDSTEGSNSSRDRGFIGARYRKDGGFPYGGSPFFNFDWVN